MMSTTRSKTPTKAITTTQDNTEKVPAQMKVATIKRSTTVVWTSKPSWRGDSSQNLSPIKIKTRFLRFLANLKFNLFKASKTCPNLVPRALPKSKITQQLTTIKNFMCSGAMTAKRITVPCESSTLRKTSGWSRKRPLATSQWDVMATQLLWSVSLK